MKIFIETPFVDNKTFGNYHISHMSYASFLNSRRNYLDIIKSGLSGSTLFARLRNPGYLHKLYIEKDKGYFRYLYEFREKYQDYDVIVMNPGVDLVHPEFLHRHFPHALKCLHFVDDPHATYSYCLPFVWAFDCATYISPSYSDEFEMSELLKLVGFNKNKWFPLCNSNINPPLYSLRELREQLLTRNNKVIYVGGYYPGKNNRLSILKDILKGDLDIYGRYPLNGYLFSILSTISGRPRRYRVRKLSNAQRESCYARYSIGLNMHLSDPACETGNARMYELAYRGVAQVVDAGGASLVNRIFEPEREILLYTNENECVDQVRRLQSDNELRMNIAMNAYKRAITEYNYQNRLLELFDWFKKIT